PIVRAGTERKWRYAKVSLGRILDASRVVEWIGTIELDIARIIEKQTPVWIDSIYYAGTHGTRLLNHIVDASFSFPKSLYTVSDCISAICAASGRVTVLDYFAGSGTTGHAAISLTRETTDRLDFILVEIGSYFDTVLLPRIVRVMYAPEWRDHRPSRLPTPEEVERTPRVVKVLRIE